MICKYNLIFNKIYVEGMKKYGIKICAYTFTQNCINSYIEIFFILFW